MTALKNHPGSWLNPEAAADFDRAEDDHGIIRITSARRTESEQQHLIDRWNQGGAANRPPYLYRPARPASTSNHVINGGQAIDTPDYVKFSVFCGDYGFVHSFPSGDPVHFDHIGVNLSTGNVKPNQTTKDRQAWLMSQGYDLGPSGADGIPGAHTKAAYAKYEEFLRDNGFGYTGNIDGIWGPQLQAAHQRYFDSKQAPPAPAPAPTTVYHLATVADISTIGDVRGLQKVAKLNGGNTKVDNVWGPESAKGLQNFLNARYGGSLATWFRRRWGYTDADDLWGPNMIAAAQRANAANFRALK